MMTVYDYLRSATDTEIVKMAEAVRDEAERRERIGKLVTEVNKLLYKLSGELCGHDVMDIIGNTTGEVLATPTDYDYNEEGKWFAPEISVRCGIK